MTIYTKAYNVGTSAVVVLQTNIMFMCICNAWAIANFLFIYFFYFADRPTLFFSPICMRNIKNNNDALTSKLVFFSAMESSKIIVEYHQRRNIIVSLLPLQLITCVTMYPQKNDPKMIPCNSLLQTNSPSYINE